MILPTISVMEGKLKGIPSINTNPLTNPFCRTMQKKKKTICSQCYSAKALKSYRKNCNIAWALNGQYLSMDRHHFGHMFNEPYVRFDSHGELINETHFLNFMAIARQNPDTTFGLWTKRVELVDHVCRGRGSYTIPNNVVMIYSSPYINKPAEVPPYFDKVFTVYDKEHAKDVDINCGNRKCIDCLICYRFDSGVTHINERIK